LTCHNAGKSAQYASGTATNLGTRRVPAVRSTDSCGGFPAVGPHVTHATRACARSAAGPRRFSCAEVDRWSSGVVARKSYQRLARVREPILRLSARGGLGSGAARHRRGALCDAVGERRPDPPRVEAFSSHRAPYAPMLLPHGSRYSAAPG